MASFGSADGRTFSAVLVAIAVVLAGVGCEDSGARQGKALFGPGSQEGTWSGFTALARPGDAVSFGSNIVLAAGERRTVTIRSVELIGVHGLKTVGVAVNGPRRTFNMIAAQPGFPRPELDGDRLPSAGVVVPEGERGLAVTFGLAREEEGRGYAEGFAVTYRIGDTAYRQVFSTGMTLCAFRDYEPDKATQPPCEPYEPAALPST